MAKRYTCEILRGPTNNSGIPLVEETASSPRAAINKALGAVTPEDDGPYTAIVYRDTGSSAVEMKLAEGLPTIQGAVDALLVVVAG